MKIVAKFKDGTTKTYGGNRQVKAAWLLRTPDGDEIIGFSIDVKTAKKTAENKARTYGTKVNLPRRGSLSMKERIFYEKQAIRLGYKDMKDMVSKVNKDIASYIEKSYIEIISVDN